MSTETVTLTDTNPLKALQHSDGTWSAREVLESGYVHKRWEDWNKAILRAKEEVEFLQIFPGQELFRSSPKKISTGNGGSREVVDYTLVPFSLMYSCQKANLPDLNLWFVFAGLQVAGYGSAPEAQSPKSERTPEQKLYRAKRDRTASMVKAVSGGGPVADQVQILAWNLLAADAPLSDVTFEFVKKWLSDQGSEVTAPALRKIYEALDRADEKIVALEMHERTFQAQAKGIPAPPGSPSADKDILRMKAMPDDNKLRG